MTSMSCENDGCRMIKKGAKLPSSGQLWGVALFKRYPGVRRVYAQSVLVFEQIPEYPKTPKPLFFHESEINN